MRHLAYWSALCIIGLLCGVAWAVIELLNTALPGAGPHERRMTRITDRRRVSDLWLTSRKHAAVARSARVTMGFSYAHPTVTKSATPNNAPAVPCEPQP